MQQQQQQRWGPTASPREAPASSGYYHFFPTLEHEKQELLIRRERIQLIYEEARAERELNEARLARHMPFVPGHQLPGTPKSEAAAPPTILVQETDDESTVHSHSSDPEEEEDEVVPATPPEEEEDEDEEQTYEALIRCAASEELKLRLRIAQECARSLRQAAAAASAVRRVKVTFLSRCPAAECISHLDSMCMPGFKEDLAGIRLYAYEVQLEAHLQKWNEALARRSRNAPPGKKLIHHHRCEKPHRCVLHSHSCATNAFKVSPGMWLPDDRLAVSSEQQGRDCLARKAEDCPCGGAHQALLHAGAPEAGELVSDAGGRECPFGICAFPRHAAGNWRATAAQEEGALADVGQGILWAPCQPQQLGRAEAQREERGCLAAAKRGGG